MENTEVQRKKLPREVKKDINQVLSECVITPKEVVVKNNQRRHHSVGTMVDIEDLSDALLKKN